MTFQQVGDAALSATNRASRVQRIPITDRATWLELRRQDLTASDIAAVAGVDPRRSALRVYAEKTAAVHVDADNNIMRRGRWLEPAVIEALRDTFPTWDIRRAGVYLRDPEIRMGATPDAIAEDPASPGLINIQCKVVAKPAYEREWDEDRAPLKFELQALSEGLLMGADRNMVAALVVDTYSAELEYRWVSRHGAAEAKVERIVRDFWSNVEAGIQPSPDYTQDAEVIAAMYPQSDPAKIADFSGDNLLPDLLAERVTLKEQIKLHEARVGEIDTEIKAKMGEAEIGELPGWKLTWKTQDRKEYTVAATTIRPLRVTDRRAKEGLI